MSNLKISTLLIGIVLFIFMSTVVLYLIGATGVTSTPYTDSASYNKLITDFNNSYAQMSPVNSVVNQMSETINNTGSSSDLGIIGVTGVLINAAFGFFRSIPTSIAFVFTIFNDIAILYNIPPWVVWVPTTIILISILATIISIVFFREV